MTAHQPVPVPPAYRARIRSRPANSRERRREALDRPVPTRQGCACRQRRFRQPGERAGIVHDARERPQQRRAVIRRHKDARSGRHGVGYRTRLGRDDRNAAGQGFGQHHAVALECGCEHEQVAVRVLRGEVPPG